MVMLAKKLGSLQASPTVEKRTLNFKKPKVLLSSTKPSDNAPSHGMDGFITSPHAYTTKPVLEQ